MPSIISVTIAYVVFFYLPGDTLDLVQKSLGFSLTLFVSLLYMRHSERPSVDGAVQAAASNKWNGTVVKPRQADDISWGLPVTQEAPAAKNPAPQVGYYQAEAHVISHLLSSVYELPCKIRYADEDAIRVTHNFVAYKLTLTGPVGFHELLKISDSLAQDINRLHRNYKYGDVRVLAVNHQPPILQVTRANPKRLDWDNRPHDLDSMQTCLGEYMHGMRSRPLSIDLSGRNSPYVVGAFIGASRSGKSAAMHVALCQLLENSSPSDIEVYGIDVTAADTFRQYEGVPHFKSIASDTKSAMAIVEQFNAWCVTGSSQDDGKVRLLVVDECQELLADTRHGDAFLEKLLKVAGVGGKLLLRMWLVTQNPDAKSYPEVLKGKTHFWAYTHMLHDRYLTKVLGLYGARELTPQSGDIIFKGPFEDGRVTTYWLDDTVRRATIAGVIAKWSRGKAEGGRRKDEVKSEGVVAPNHSEVTLVTSPSLVDEDSSSLLPKVITLPSTEGNHPSSLLAVEFPIPHRPPTPHEAEAIVALARSGECVYRGALSMNRLIEKVWTGKKNKDKLKWIKEVLDSGGIEYSVKE